MAKILLECLACEEEYKTTIKAYEKNPYCDKCSSGFKTVKGKESKRDKNRDW